MNQIDFIFVGGIGQLLSDARIGTRDESEIGSSRHQLIVRMAELVTAWKLGRFSLLNFFFKMKTQQARSGSSAATYKPIALTQRCNLQRESLDFSFGRSGPKK